MFADTAHKDGEWLVRYQVLETIGLHIGNVRTAAAVTTTCAHNSVEQTPTGLVKTHCAIDTLE